MDMAVMEAQLGLMVPMDTKKLLIPHHRMEVATLKFCFVGVLSFMVENNHIR